MVFFIVRYVTNYIKVLAEYGETLNALFKDYDEEREQANFAVVYQEQPPAQSRNTISNDSSSKLNPISRLLVSLAALLELHLDAKFKLCKDSSLQHLFLMNNIHYMVQKVKGSELPKPIFGEEWIRKRNWICRKCAMDYERASGSVAVMFRKDKGIPSSGSGSTSKILIKERLRSFYLAFEEIYRTRTAWTFTDEELREDLRISISLKVILAYRTLEGRFSSCTSKKYIKYSAYDLENYLLNLFEGSSKSLPSPCR